MPLRSVQTVRIVKLYNPLSEMRQGNILSVLNEMQFTDRYTDPKVPLRSQQTVRIVKPYKPLSQIRLENILSVLNEMQFTDCIRTEKCFYDVFSDRVSLSNRTDREVVFSDRISLSILNNPPNHITF